MLSNAIDRPHVAGLRMLDASRGTTGVIDVVESEELTEIDTMNGRENKAGTVFFTFPEDDYKRCSIDDLTCTRPAEGGLRQFNNRVEERNTPDSELEMGSPNQSWDNCRAQSSLCRLSMMGDLSDRIYECGKQYSAAESHHIPRHTMSSRSAAHPEDTNTSTSIVKVEPTECPDHLDNLCHNYKVQSTVCDFAWISDYQMMPNVVDSISACSVNPDDLHKQEQQICHSMDVFQSSIQSSPISNVRIF